MNESGNESVVFVYNLAEYLANAVSGDVTSRTVKLRGLQEEAEYQIEGAETIYQGKMLMEVGLDIPLRGAYKSCILRITKVK